MDKKDIIDFFKHDIYAMETTGIEILEASKDHAKTRLRIGPKHMNANNTVMGGCIYTLADFTFALAANTDNNPTCTISSNIIFNSPGKGEYLYAESKVIKSGRTIASFEIVVTDDQDRLIATATMVGSRKA